MQSSRSRWITLGAAFALFGAGVWALSLERGGLRTALLTVVFAGLLAIAGWQTRRRAKEKKG